MFDMRRGYSGGVVVEKGAQGQNEAWGYLPKAPFCRRRVLVRVLAY
jgi:hypothetical protein